LHSTQWRAHQISAELNIELNARENLEYWTAFHLACIYGKANIVEMMIDNAESFNFDLMAKDKEGRTGFMLVKHYGRPDVMNLIKRKLPSIAL
jgi:ankyrin repeat protein